MIKSLHIRKFLGIDNLTIDKLNKVNIIGGKPGSGKTRVLSISIIVISIDLGNTVYGPITDFITLTSFIMIVIKT